MSEDAAQSSDPQGILRRVRTTRRRRRPPLTVDELVGWATRLPDAEVRVASGRRADIPAIVSLIAARKPSVPPVPLKFDRTPERLAATWSRVHWLLARGRGGDLLGCIELRPVDAEDGVWEIGSFSQAATNRNPRVPVKLWVAAFRKLRDLQARAAVVEIHARNESMWAFLAPLAFEPDARPSSHPDFVRYRLALS